MAASVQTTSTALPPVAIKRSLSACSSRPPEISVSRMCGCSFSKASFISTHWGLLDWYIHDMTVSSTGSWASATPATRPTTTKRPKTQPATASPVLCAFTLVPSLCCCSIASSLEPAKGDPFHEVALSQQEDDHHRDQRADRRRHDQGVVRRILRDKHPDAQLDRAQPGRVEIDQRPKEVVPHKDKRQDG